MRVIVTSNNEEIGEIAGGMITKVVQDKPTATLGLFRSNEIWREMMTFAVLSMLHQSLPLSAFITSFTTFPSQPTQSISLVMIALYKGLLSTTFQRYRRIAT